MCMKSFTPTLTHNIISEQPRSNSLCPRRNGFFAHPDPAVCNVFYNCIEGEANEITCTAGLHFDEYSGTCVWPNDAGRQGCNPGANSNSIATLNLLSQHSYTSESSYRAAQGRIHLPEGTEDRRSRPNRGSSQVRSPNWLPTVLRLPEWRGTTWLGMPSWRGLQRGNGTLRRTGECSWMVSSTTVITFLLASFWCTFYYFSEDWYKDSDEKKH